MWTKTLCMSSPFILGYFLFLCLIFTYTDTTIDKYPSVFMFVIDLLFVITKYLIFPFFLINIPRYILYRQTSFEFTDNVLLYRMNFISLSQKTVKYRDIKEVTLYRSPLQKCFGLGTVNIITHATTKDVGMKLFNIKEYQTVYDFLMKQVKD